MKSLLKNKNFRSFLIAMSVIAIVCTLTYLYYFLKTGYYHSDIALNLMTSDFREISYKVNLTLLEFGVNSEEDADRIVFLGFILITGVTWISTIIAAIQKDFVKSEDKVVWIIIILFSGLLAVLVYFFTEVELTITIGLFGPALYVFTGSAKGTIIESKD